jgi:hypothetical protein
VADHEPLEPVALRLGHDAGKVHHRTLGWGRRAQRDGF